MPRKKGAGRPKSAPTKQIRTTVEAAEAVKAYAESEGLSLVDASHVLIVSGRASAADRPSANTTTDP